MRISIKIIILSILYFQLFLFVNADNKLGIDSILKDHIYSNGLRGADVGVYVASLSDPHDVILSYNEKKAKIPASCLKLITSFVALEVLGSEYTYQTKILSDGVISKDGSLNGNVVLYSEGDPSLTERYWGERGEDILREMVSDIVEQGVKNISGSVYLDATAFDNQLMGDGWSNDYEEESYAAKVTSIPLNENCINFKVRSNISGYSSTSVVLLPANDFVQIQNNISIGSPKSKFSVGFKRINDTDSLVLSGNLPAGQESGVVWATSADPLELTASIFKEILKENNIKFKGDVVVIKHPSRTILNSKYRSLSIHTSPPLRELLKPVNKNSHNIFAELIFKSLGYRKYRLGSYSNAERVTVSVFKKARIPIDGFKQYDGCGLSPSNHITPQQIGMVLAYANKQPYGNDYYESLSIAGIDGSLRRSRLGDLHYDLRGKTGGIKGVRSLSGYITTQKGNKYVFCFVANNVKNRYAVQDMENNLLRYIHQNY